MIQNHPLMLLIERNKMDLTVLAENLGLDRETFLELVDVFISSAENDMKKFRLAVDSGDSEQAAEAAHSMKGASGNMGFTDFSEIAQNAEMDARKGQLTNLDQYLNRFAEALTAIKQVR